MEDQFEFEDDLRASNLLLKLKLELEHGLPPQDTAELYPSEENRWLQNHWDFEKQYRDPGRISIYDFVGRPAFTPIELLTPEELPGAITEMFDHLRGNGIFLDFLHDYEDSIVYRFIITEFFAHEMDSVIIEGGAWCYTYEEFHPNHDSDLRRSSDHFMRGVLGKKWNEFETFVLAEKVALHNTQYSRSGISCLISFFQDQYTAIELDLFTIQNVHIDLEEMKSIVRGDVVYRICSSQKEELIEGPVILHFDIRLGCWEIVQIELPGL